MPSGKGIRAPSYRLSYALPLAIGVFVLIGVADGLWKGALLVGPMSRFWAYDLFKWILLPIALLVLLHRRGVRFRDYGLSAETGAASVLYLLPLVLFTLFTVYFLASKLTGFLFGYPQNRFSYPDALAPLGPLRIVGTVYFALTAGLWESIFFIGLPRLWLKREAAKAPLDDEELVGVSAILFALDHWENGFPNVVGAFCFQFFAFRWYLKLNTLWPIIGAHFLIDLYYFWPAK